jgi:hypothetical protein
MTNSVNGRHESSTRSVPSSTSTMRCHSKAGRRPLDVGAAMRRVTALSIITMSLIGLTSSTAHGDEPMHLPPRGCCAPTASR